MIVDISFDAKCVLPNIFAIATRLVSYAPDDMDGEGEEEENQEDADESMFIGNGINSVVRNCCSLLF